MKTTLLLILILPSIILALDGKVIKVSDGDTITILTEQKEQIRIRLNGIDAPEEKQAYGNKARLFLADMIAGQMVFVEEHKKDRYGRVVGTIYFNDYDINEQMVLNGYAWAYVKYDKKYKLHEIQAKRQGLGLWQDKNPIPPWEFRKLK
ncbi:MULTISPECIES: thermonuclease family protein [unclassified Campylobacter]|uniref:thermonuclease family protein n=1 Tax=unclassified Campylobacter TaxID=2593542 RepID=UPI003D338FD4